MDEEIFLNLKNCLNPDNEIRKKAETFIENAKIFKFEILLQNLFFVFSDTVNNIDNSMKNMASVLYKNILLQDNTWINLNLTQKNKIREDLNSLIEKSNDENQIKNVCIILAIILFKECQNNNIKNFKLIIKKLQNWLKENNNKLIISYLYIIKTFFDQFEEQKLLPIDIINGLQSIIIPIIKNYNKENMNQNIIEDRKLELSLDIYSLILPFMKYSFTMETDYIFKPIIDLIQKLNKENKIYMQNLIVVNDTINYYHFHIINHIKTLCTILFDLLKEISEKEILNNNNQNNNIIINDNSNYTLSNIVLYYLDIICLICDKELIDKTSLTTMFIDNAEEKYIPILLKLLDKYPELKIDNESWNISKAVCYILSFIVIKSSQDKILFKLLDYFSLNFNSISLNNKINSILILSCILESKNMRTVNDSIQNEILNIIKKVDDENKIYSYIISWILGKISENLPSLFPKDDLKEIIPRFINIINNKGNYSNEVRINICIVFGNLIKFYGDENTNNSSNELNLYYKYFINDFIESSFKEENIMSGLSFYLIRIIMNSIQYSSKDMQGSLEIIFSNILNKFDLVSNSIKNNKNNLKKDKLEKLYKLQENLCLVLNQIFNKIILNINIALCVKLYNSIIDSFLIRDGKAYESGMLCLLNLVILLFNENILKVNKIDVEIFYKLMSAILINEGDGDILKKIAILCLLNLIKINSFTLSKYIVEIYEIIKTIGINRNTVNEELKKLLEKTIKEVENSDIYKNKKKF